MKKIYWDLDKELMLVDNCVKVRISDYTKLLLILCALLFLAIGVS